MPEEELLTTQQYLSTLALSLPEIVESITRKEMRIFKIQQEVADLKLAIQIAEDHALMAGTIDGKNQEIREAQLRLCGGDQRGALREAERRLAYEKIELSGLHLQFKALRTMGQFLAPNTYGE